MTPNDSTPGNAEPAVATPEDLETLAMNNLTPCDWPQDRGDDGDEDEPQIELPD